MLGARQADIISLEDDSCSEIPREAKQGAASLARWIHTLFDPKTLADEARLALAEVAPFVSLSAHFAKDVFPFELNRLYCLHQIDVIRFKNYFSLNSFLSVFDVALFTL